MCIRDSSTTADFEVVTTSAAPSDLIGSTATWSYFDLGFQPVDQGANDWTELGYSDAAWARGTGEFGYGDDDETTLTSKFDAAGDLVITTYFRHLFAPGNLAEFDTFTMSLLRDDGAVVYLNGQELGRTNMGDGPVSYDTFATDASEQTIQVDIEPSAFVAGINVLAVEIHQRSLTSSDISFAASLNASASDAPRVSDATEGTYVLTAGDMARCNFDGDEAVAAQMEELFDTDQGVFLGLGDLVYNSGTIDEFTACYEPNFGQFIDSTWPSVGNHEHRTTPNAAGYRTYFGPAAGPLAAPNGGLWYSFDIDDFWHVIALDSDCSGREPLPGAFEGDGCAVGSEQEQWLRADLEANQDKNILAFFHHPPFTNNNYLDFEVTAPLWRALAEYGTELTLHGHEHQYERYKPLDYWGENAEVSGNPGITEFIVGSGGTFPRINIREAEADSAFRGNFPFGTDDFGVLQLWLRPDGYEWKWDSVFGLAESDSGIAGLTEAMDRSSIRGTVRLNDAPVVGATVCAVASRTEVQTCAVTTSNGMYEIGPLVGDSYEVSTLDPATNGAVSLTVSLSGTADVVGDFDLIQVLPSSIAGLSLIHI